MKEVINPYNFIAFQGEKKALTIKAQKESLKAYGARHDVYNLGQLSGDITFSIISLTPVINGLKQVEVSSLSQVASLQGVTGNAKAVLPYVRENCYALSGNSLRGMLSSIAEVVASAGPKVLEDKPYSVRQKAAPTGESFAYGVLQREESEQGIQYSIKPIGIAQDILGPPHKKEFSLTKVWQRVFVTDSGEPMTLDEVLAVRIKETVSEKTSKVVGFNGNKPEVVNVSQSFVISPSSEFAALPVTASFTQDEVWAKQMDTNANNKKKPNPNWVVRLIRDGSLFPSEVTDARPVALFKNIKKMGQRVAFTGNEKGEFRAASIHVPEDVLNTYIDLLSDAEAGEALKDKKSKNIIENKLDGRIILFSAEVSDDGVKVLRVTEGMMWRKTLQNKESSYDFLPEDMLPYSHKRDSINSVEALFGVVSKSARSADNTNVTALASRISFHDAISTSPLKLEEAEFFRLPRAGSPKTPCPSMYFHNPETGAFIDKQRLNCAEHIMNGAKRYIRFTPEINSVLLPASDENAGSDDKHIIRVTPVAEGTKFTTSISFSNLHPAELGLLLKCIMPSESYVHQIGMGKNQGLGQIKFDDVQCNILAEDRYSAAGMQAARFSNVLTADTADTFVQSNAEMIDALQVKRLCKLNRLISDGSTVCFPVGTKTTKRGKSEASIFQWFMNNEKDKNPLGKQMLPRLMDDELEFGKLKSE